MITAEQFTRSGNAILAAADEAGRPGVSLCLNAGTAALADGNHDIAGAMLDEAAARAGIIGTAKLAQLHQDRLTGNRP